LRGGTRWRVVVGPGEAAAVLPPGAPRPCSSLGRCPTLSAGLRARARARRRRPGVDGGWRWPSEGCNAGTGMAVSHVATRCNSPLTGHDVGRGRSSRSLYCLSCVATRHSVRMTVRGWAVASPVGASVCVRRAGWRPSAPHARRRRTAVARHVVAEGRALWRSHLTAVRSLSPCPRAP
jgi:hypothetical protein